MKSVFDKPTIKSPPNYVRQQVTKHIVVPTLSAFGGVLAAHALLVTPAPIDIYRATAPSVVTVSSIGFKRDTFSTDFQETVNGEGTGFSFKGGQFIVTNAHVVEDALAIKVTDAVDTEYEATVIGRDALHDIALLKINPKSNRTLKPLAMCQAPALIGDPVLAIGNPFGLERTLTSGLISATNRSIGPGGQIDRPPLVRLIQTDAAINPGNSGGPLLDAKKGCVLGVNTAMISASGSSAGVGFAMPITTVGEIVDGFISGEDQARARPQLGVTIVQDSIAEFLGMKGAIIAHIIKDGHADSIGLVGTHRDESGRPVIGDVIIGINGRKISNGMELFAVMDALSKGDSITLTVLKDSGIQEYHIVL